MKPETKRKRRDDEPPDATARRGWRFHHLGIPVAEARPGMRRIPELGIAVSGFDRSPYGVEWMFFEPGCAVAEVLRKVPHLAFEVDDLEAAIAGKALLGPVGSPSPGVRVAMFLDDDGAPIEVLEFARKK